MTYTCAVCDDSFHRCSCEEPILMSNEPKHLAQADCEYDPLGKYQEAKKIPAEYVKPDPDYPRTWQTFDGHAESLNKVVTPEEMIAWCELADAETDPDNIPASAPGSKLDAGKSPITRGCLQYFPNALEAVAKVSEVGANKYTWKGWESVRDGERRYMDACGRHLGRAEINPPKYDNDTHLLHLAQVAWNSLAALELLLRKGTPVTDPTKG